MPLNHTPNATCHQCGAPYYTKPNRLARSRFCSVECRYESQKGPRPICPDLKLTYTVNEATGCWEWSGTISVRGYGVLKANGIRYIAHRLSFEQANHPLPSSWDVHHRCGNKRCICPEHLEALPHGRHTLTHNHGRSPVSPEDVATIRSLRGVVSQSKLAKRFGITQSAVSKIQLRQAPR